jgi:L-ascorbate metabolism protein UlaG (beta-lactamase superfamily)
MPAIEACAIRGPSGDMQHSSVRSKKLMRISKYIHSCLLVEKEGDKILFDPGRFSFVEGLVTPQQFQNLSAVVLTHQHPDHIDEDALQIILTNNPSAIVLTNTEIQIRLVSKGIGTENFEAGRRALRSFTIAAFDAPHAPILDADPPQNTAYLIDDIFLHPGDSFADSLFAKKNTPILALPIMAPWMTELDVVDFAHRMSPQRIIPIHDGYAKEFFLQQRYNNLAKHFTRRGIQFQWMSQPGDSVETEHEPPKRSL